MKKIINIDEIMSKITSYNAEKNKNIFLKEYETLNYRNDEGNSLYHLIITSNASSIKIVYAITMLVDNKINPNMRNKTGDTFMHIAFNGNTNINDITYLLDYAIKVGNLDVNTRNDNYYTLLHTTILTAKQDSDILKIAKVLKDNNFNFTEEIKEFVNDSSLSQVMKSNILNTFAKNDSERHSFFEFKDSNKVKNTKYGTVLNNKEYHESPALGRDKEISKIIISLATEKKLPLLVGPSGVGKTTIIDELAYRIINDDVPSFLKDKIIYEVHMSSILAGTKYRGDFENNMKEVINYAIRNNAILFIDEFHMVFGIGANDKDNTDAASILKTYIDRYNLKVIGATTKVEYEKFMVQDALKRRFDVIKVDELDNDKLYDIAFTTFERFAQKRNIEISEYFKDNINNIINILLELTKDKNRRYDDKVYNPDLLISIIDRTIAYALVEESILDIKHLILSIDDSERIYSYAKEIAIKKLNNLEKSYNENNSNIIDFNSYKKVYTYNR